LFLQGVAFDITAIKEAELTLREQTRLATLRADVSAAITRTDTLSGMLDRCVAALERDLEDVSAARLWIFDEQQNILELIAAGSAKDQARIAPGQGQVGLIAAGRAPAHTNDAGASFAGYPLLIEDRLLGVLALSSGLPLSPAVLQTLELIADQIALGIK